MPVVVVEQPIADSSDMLDTVHIASPLLGTISFIPLMK